MSFAYKDSLQTTIKESDRTLTDQLQKTDSMISELERGTAQDVNDAMKQVQQIALTLPLTARDPQLTRQSPRLVSIASDQIVLKLDGVFYYAKDQGYEPYAEIGQTRIPASTETNKLMFILNKSDLLSDPNKMIINKIRVVVPYNTRCWYCFFGVGKADATFSLLLGVLPENAGTLEVSATHTIPVSDEKSVTSGDLGLSSQDCCDKEEDVCDAAIPSGWSYVDGSVEFIDLVEIGGSRKFHDWDEKGPRIGTSVCWHVQTWQHSHGTDGNISFKLRYRIKRSVDQDTSDAIAKYELKWGDSLIVPLPDRTTNWVAKYTMFDGKKVNEVSQPGLTDPPYVELIRPSAGAIQVKVAPPPDF